MNSDSFIFHFGSNDKLGIKGEMSMIEAAGLSTADWILLGVVALALPVETEISTHFFKRRILAKAPKARLHMYRYAIATLWLPAAAILVGWHLSGRDWAALGFHFGADRATLIACAAAALIAVVLLLQRLSLSFSKRALKTYQNALRQGGDAFYFMFYFMPQTSAEYRTFQLLGVTAGITEEIIFRGFLIWALSILMPLWLAALLSLALFVFLHRYQGMAGMMQVSLIGGALTAIYMASGSLYVAIVLHILIDLFVAASFWRGRIPETAQ